LALAVHTDHGGKPSAHTGRGCGNNGETGSNPDDFSNLSDDSGAASVPARPNPLAKVSTARRA
jgi:hypothetical protein